MADGIKISVDVLAKDAAKELDEFLKNVKFQQLQLETAFKKTTITAAEYAKGLTKLEADVKNYGVATLKTERALYALNNAQIRGKEGLTSLGGKLNEIKDKIGTGTGGIGSVVNNTTNNFNNLSKTITNKTNPSFISFNQIIQDAPFGIRGVGNNIQFLTQQFTQLRAHGMSTTDILKGMLKNALTPMGGLMLGVSLGTTLLTLAFDSFAKSTEKVKDETKELTDSIAELEMQTKHISEGQYLQYLQSNILDAKKAYEEALKPQSNYIDQMVAWGKWLVNNPIGRALQNIWLWIEMAASGYRKLLGLIGGGSGTVSGQFDFSIIDENYKKLLKSEKKYDDERKRLRKEREREEKELLKPSGAKFYDPNNVSPLSTFAPNADLGATQKSMMAKLFAFENEQHNKTLLIDAETLEVKRDYLKVQQQSSIMSDADYIKELEKLKTIYQQKEALKDVAEVQKEINRVKGEEGKDAAKDAKAKKKSHKDELRDLQRTYNSMFFDPLAAGFRDLGQQLFGTEGHLNALKSSFGQVGAAIVQSLEMVIMKLVETAAMAAILNLIFPGSGTFASNFMNLIGIGDLKPGKASGGMLTDGFTPVGEYGMEYAYKQGNNVQIFNNQQSTGVAIAAASRKQQQSRQNIVISGKFVQSGADMVAVVEVNQLKRNTRSMNVSR